MLRRTIKQLLHQASRNNYRPLNRIELSRQRLLDNVALVQRQHPDYVVIPVLKGNAYGHGIQAVATILRDSPVQWLAVDGYFEAAQIRDWCPQRLLVLGHVRPENVGLLDIKRCSFVVQDIDGLRALGRLRKPVRIHVELNTGMNRLGLQPHELAAYLDELHKYPNLELEGVMSHLADADNPDDDSFTALQAKRFDNQVEQILQAGFTPRIIHLANTAGSTHKLSRYANALRLGIGTYGLNPLDSSDRHAAALHGLRPVLSLKSTIIKVQNLQPGDKVSYSCTFTARRAMRIGVLPLGFYEGVPRALSGKGVVTHGQQRLPIVGRICMNHTMVDLGDSGLQVGNEVTVICDDPTKPNSMAGWQRHHNLFMYESCTGLSSTIRREIV